MLWLILHLEGGIAEEEKLFLFYNFFGKNSRTTTHISGTDSCNVVLPLHHEVFRRRLHYFFVNEGWAKKCRQIFGGKKEENKIGGKHVLAGLMLNRKVRYNVCCYHEQFEGRRGQKEQHPRNVTSTVGAIVPRKGWTQKTIDGSLLEEFQPAAPSGLILKFHRVVNFFGEKNIACTFLREESP